MSHPVKILIDGYQFCGEDIPKGEIFDCPTEYKAAWLEKNGVGKRVNVRGKVPASPGSYRLVSAKPKGSYRTRVMKPEKSGFEIGGPDTEKDDTTDATGEDT